MQYILLHTTITYVVHSYMYNICIFTTGVNPMDNLKVNDLRIELSLRRVATANNEEARARKGIQCAKGRNSQCPSSSPRDT